MPFDLCLAYRSPSTSFMPYRPGRLAGQELGGGQGAVGVAIAVGGADGHLHRFAQQAEDDRVLARIVADADGVVADFAVRPLAGPAFAAVAMRGLAHRAGDDLAELQGRAAGRIFLEAVVPLDDFHVGAADDPSAPGRRPRPSFIARLTARLMLGDQSSGISAAASRSLLVAARRPGPVVATTSGIFLLEAGFDDRRRPAGTEKSMTTSTGRVERCRQRHAERADAGDQAGIFAQLADARRVDGGDESASSGRPRPARPAAAPCGRRRREWQCELA